MAANLFNHVFREKYNFITYIIDKQVPSYAHLGSDLKSGKLTLTSYATLKGKVHLFKVIKKKKSAQMNCTMDVDTKKQAIQNVHCK